MNLEKLFSLQKTLDTQIQMNHDLIGKPLLAQKMLSLQVKLAKLADETGCYKFWSAKKTENKNVLLDKYIDCLYSILTIGLEKGFVDIPEISLKPLSSDITNQFISLSIDVNDFIVCSSKDHYITLFEDFLSLGNSLNFTEEDMETRYEKNFKYKVNFSLVLN